MKEATRSLRIGVILEAYSVIPLGVHLILKGEKSTVGAFDSLGGDLYKILPLKHHVYYRKADCLGCIIVGIGTG